MCGIVNEEQEAEFCSSAWAQHRQRHNKYVASNKQIIDHIKCNKYLPHKCATHALFNKPNNWQTFIRFFFFSFEFFSFILKTVNCSTDICVCVCICLYVCMTVCRCSPHCAVYLFVSLTEEGGFWPIFSFYIHTVVMIVF